MKILLPQTDINKVILLTQDLWPHIRGKRILLTGGTGFIGSWLLTVMQKANDDLNIGMQFSVVTRNLVAAKKKHPTRNGGSEPFHQPKATPTGDKPVRQETQLAFPLKVLAPLASATH